MKKALTTLAVAVMLVMGSAVAQADTMISSWSYTVDGIFVDYTSTASNGSSGIYTTGGTTLNGQSGYKDLSWGPEDERYLWGLINVDNYDNRSGVIISDAASGTVDTNGAQALGVQLTHRNNSISSTYNTLDSGSVYMTLTLTALTVDGQTLEFDTTLHFDFYETTNSGNLQNDIFIVTNVEASIESFDYEGYTYYFSFLTSFQDLTQTAYAGFLTEGQKYGWITEEGATTTIDTYLIVSSTPIELPGPTPQPTPEPATVLLMGAGLAGLALANRRRNRK